MRKNRVIIAKKSIHAVTVLLFSNITMQEVLSACTQMITDA